MADFMDKNTRSKLMSRIRSRNTGPELLLKELLRDFEYQPNVFGRPDFINYKKKIVMFVDGCFWHQCPIHSKIPKQNSSYWIPKLLRNLTRAKEVGIAYRNSGWKVVRIWEHDLNNLSKNHLKFKKSVLFRTKD